MLRYLHKRVGRGVITPDLRQTCIAAGVFLQQDRAVIRHGHVVKHHLAFAAVEQHLHRATKLRIAGVRELQRPQAAGTRRRGGGHKIEGLPVLAPAPIFRPQPVRHIRCDALRVQLSAALGFHIAQIHQFKRADPIAQPQPRFIRARQVPHLGVGGA